MKLLSSILLVLACPALFTHANHACNNVMILCIYVLLFLLQEEYDTHDPKGPYSPVLPFKRTKVIEIVAARDIVFALAHSGVCAAFSRGSSAHSYPYNKGIWSIINSFFWVIYEILFLFLDNAGITQSLLAILNAETNERICFLNVSPDEVIRSLFYNKNNDSLITVSVYASDSFSSLKCRSTRIECVELLLFTFLLFIFNHFNFNIFNLFKFLSKLNFFSF